MQRAGILLLSLTASFLMLTLAHGQDASDRFLQAWQEFQSGEKLEREAQPLEAMEKYQAAVKILEKIAADQPDWQPLVIEYRLKKTRESIIRLEPQISQIIVQVNPEGPLPQADRGGTPEVSSIPLSIRAPGHSIPNIESRTTPGTELAEPDDLRAIRKQMLSLKREKEQLARKLMSKTAELQSARMEIDKTKVTVVELRSQLAQATSALNDAQKDENSVGSQQKALEARLAQVMEEVTTLSADNEVLSEENTRLLGKLDLAAKYISGSDSIRENLLKERRQLADARDTAVARTKKIKDNAAEIEKVTAENRELKGKVAEFEKTYVKRAELEKLAAQNKELTEKIQEAERSSVSKKEWEKLAAEKNSLETKYEEAEKRLAEATAANPERDKMVAELQSELNGVNDRLLESQAQMNRGQELIRDLQRQLDETAGELARLKINGNTKDQQNLAAENDLLRGIIFRQIKEQTQRDEAKKLLEQEIATLQIKSDIISKQLATLGAPVIQLTPEEKALFKQPIALLNEPTPQTLEVKLAMTKTAPGDPVPAPIENATPAVPENTRAQMEQAKQLFSSKDYLGAEKLYQQIVEEVPDNYIILSNLGAVQIEAGKFSAAEVALKRAIEINPGDASAYTYLGVAYSRQGKFDEASSVLRQAIAINEENAVAHNYLGVCFGQKENAEPAEAEKEFKRAIEINQEYPEAHFNLAVLYVNGKPPALELARIHYDKATQLGAVPDPSLERLIQ